MPTESTYKGMYECDCKNLTRRLPFRAEFTDNVVSDLQVLYTDTTKDLVYVTQGPGGLLFDFLLLNKLIDTGYTSITVVFIEELYQEQIEIIRACLDFKQWCEHIAHKASVTSHFFTSIKEYVQSCSKKPELRGHLLVTVDADDKKTVPEFDSVEFRSQFAQTVQATMRPTASFYYLFYQNKLRHMLIGRIYQESELLIAYQHSYGADSLLEHKKNRLFLGTQEALPFESIKNSVQVDGKIIESKKFSQLLEDPLAHLGT